MKQTSNSETKMR